MKKREGVDAFSFRYGTFADGVEKSPHLVGVLGLFGGEVKDGSTVADGPAIVGVSQLGAVTIQLAG